MPRLLILISKAHAKEKRVLKTTLWLITSIVLIVLIALGIVIWQQDTIVKKVLIDVNKGFPGNVELGEFKLKPLKGFPNITLQIDNTKIYEDSTNTTGVMAVEERKEQTSPNGEPCEDTVTEVQETTDEQNDLKAEVHEASTDRPVQTNEGDDPTADEKETPEPSTKKDLIPDLETFKDLDERAVQVTMILVINLCHCFGVRSDCDC